MPEQVLMPDQERRCLTARELRVDTGADGKPMIRGYAALFDSPSVDMGFIETIDPGAFKKSLKAKPDVRALWNHDPNIVLGRTTAGTLRLATDETGLAVEIDLPDTTDGRDLATLIERGDVSGMSFGFIVTKQTWDETLSLIHI